MQGALWRCFKMPLKYCNLRLYFQFTSSGLEKVRIGDVVISSKVKASEGFKTLRGTELLSGNFLEVLFEMYQIDGLLSWSIQMNWKLKYIAVVIINIILSYLLPQWIWWHLCKISWGICSWDRRHRPFITETDIRCLTLSSWRQDGNTIVIFFIIIVRCSDKLRFLPCYDVISQCILRANNKKWKKFSHWRDVTT